MGNCELELSETLRFLGLKITNTGTFSPWRDDFTCNMYGAKGKLTQAGLGNLPVAMVQALKLKTLPAVLYGCEIWALTWVSQVLGNTTISPYKHPRLDIITNFLKSYLGMPQNAFGAATMRALNFPSMLHLTLPRMTKWLHTLSDTQWECIHATPGPLCKAMVHIYNWRQAHPDCINKHITHIETRFWEA